MRPLVHPRLLVEQTIWPGPSRLMSSSSSSTARSPTRPTSLAPAVALPQAIASLPLRGRSERVVKSSPASDAKASTTRNRA
jgi:hypothetical protein